jgi:hypothetical protein
MTALTRVLTAGIGLVAGAAIGAGPAAATPRANPASLPASPGLLSALSGGLTAGPGRIQLLGDAGAVQPGQAVTRVNEVSSTNPESAWPMSSWK